MTEKKQRLFSGIQPSGNLTLGNYLGALKNWVGLQDKYDCFFSLVDLHTITVHQDPKKFRENCYDALAIYLAAGIDPDKHTVFLQSQVPAHTQLAWILNCCCYMGELSRMTQFKDKSQKHEANINVGLFTYPVLMASDILLYDTNIVPIGSDQKQHLELARDLALRFNGIYGDIFTVPEIYFPPLGAKIMSLQDPDKKMSKSDENLAATIFLLDDPSVISHKSKRAVTDSGSDIAYDVENKPGVSNLLTILALITDRSVEDWVGELEGGGYGKLKTAVSDGLVEYLKPVQEKYKELRKNQKYLDSVLKEGAKKANSVSKVMLKKVYDCLGFVL